MPNIDIQMSASALGRALAAGDICPVELTQTVLARAEEGLESSIFTSVTRGRALKEARASKSRLDAGRALSGLDGVPVVHKDLIDLAGEITTAGSQVYRNSAPRTKDAEVATNLTAAGMVCVGKVNLSEFAYSGLGLNPHFGTPPNPLSKDVERAPGGSSSGTAVAISSGIVPCGVGTDTGGSIRIPASFNGLVGFKPSSGRISKEGVFALSQTLDTVGPIARSVEDCIQIDMALRGKCTGQIRRNLLEDVTIFVPENVVLETVSTAVLANFERSLKQLEARGARIVRKVLHCINDAQVAFKSHGSLTAAEAYTNHQNLVRSDKQHYLDSRVLTRILGGENMKASDVLSLLQARKMLVLASKLEIQTSIIAMPTTAISAPEIAPLEANDELFHEINALVLRNTSIGNFLDLPGLALPNGLDENGMPTSILMSTASGSDERLLSWGFELERALSN